LAVDAVDGGIIWATTSLTYSFPTSGSFYTGAMGTLYGSEPTNNFKPFTAIQQAAVTSALAMYSSVSNLTFTKITESSSQSATLRYAESDTPSTAYGYFPSTSPQGGDAWFNNSTHWYDNPVPGNYAWLSIMHETGHLLGLKHPQDTSGVFGAIPASLDSLEYSVMSYRSYAGASTSGGYTNGTFGYPQTLMMYDIAAIQHMYGANFNFNAGDTVYKWSPATGQEFINGISGPIGRSWQWSRRHWQHRQRASL
jgi:serralysin